MRRTARIVVAVLAGALGVGASLAIGAGSGNVRACVVKSSGRLHATDSKGRCARSEFAITIGGDAFKKSSRGQTLTINGVSFAKGRGNTLTINGTAFKGSSRGQTLTINGIPFHSSSGNTLTINGMAFEAAPDGSIKLNGTQCCTGTIPGPQGPAGPEGKIGPTGPPGIPYGPPPVEVAGTTSVGAAPARTTLASAQLATSDGKAHRVLVTGGFDAACNPCGGLQARYGVMVGGAAAFERSLATMQDNGVKDSGAVVSEIVVTPTACGPCTFDLVANFTGGGAGQAPKLDASHVRLGLLDLGPVASSRR